MDTVCKELKKLENKMKSQEARIEQLEKKIKSRKPVSAPGRMENARRLSAATAAARPAAAAPSAALPAAAPSAALPAAHTSFHRRLLTRRQLQQYKIDI